MDVLKEQRQLQPMYACDGVTAETFENWSHVINQKKKCVAEKKGRYEKVLSACSLYHLRNKSVYSKRSDKVYSKMDEELNM